MGKCFIEIECDVCQNWQAKLCSAFYLKERMILAVRLSDHINRATEIGKQKDLGHTPVRHNLLSEITALINRT